jgi:hypothetical protein
MFGIGCLFFSRLGVIGRSMLDLPAMPLGGLGRMSSCLDPVTMIMPPSFVMHGRRVFDVHLSYGINATCECLQNNLALMGRGVNPFFNGAMRKRR